MRHAGLLELGFEVLVGLLGLLGVLPCRVSASQRYAGLQEMEFGFGIWLRSGGERCEMYRKENKLGWPPGGPSSAGPRDVGSPPPRTLNFRTGIEEQLYEVLGHGITVYLRRFEDAYLHRCAQTLNKVSWHHVQSLVQIPMQ